MSDYWEDILNLLLCRAPYAGCFAQRNIGEVAEGRRG
mgnify:FL=1